MSNKICKYLTTKLKDALTVTYIESERLFYHIGVFYWIQKTSLRMKVYAFIRSKTFLFILHMIFYILMIILTAIGALK